MSERKREQINANLMSGKTPESAIHIGLANTNRRIKLEYGEAFGIALHNREGPGLLARMTVPLRRMGECTT